MTTPGLRILMTTDAVGGVWTYTLDLAGGLVAAGATVKVVVLGPALRADQRAELARRGLDAVETHLPLEWLAADEAEVRDAADAIAARAAAWDADLVHLHTPAFAAARGGFAGPVIATIHSCVATWWAAVRGGPLPEDFRWRAALVGEGLRQADLVLAPTASYAKAVADVYDLPRIPLAVHNGRSAPMSEAGHVPSEEIVTAGRLWDDGKNIAALDRVAARLPWPVRAAGDIAGPDGTRVILSNIELLGRQSDSEMRALLARRPIFVSPARFEPFGLAVLEAAQAGCALVLSDIATFRELWDGVALFADADDAEALAAAIRTLIEDRGRRAALGQAAQRRAGRYTVAAMVAATRAAYDLCLCAAPRLVAVGA